MRKLIIAVSIFGLMCSNVFAQSFSKTLPTIWWGGTEPFIHGFDAKENRALQYKGDGTWEWIKLRDGIIDTGVHFYETLPYVDGDSFLQLQDDGTWKWKLKDRILIPPKIDFLEDESVKADVIFRDLERYKSVCFELPGDSKRCVNLKWLYLFFVAADIKEEK